MWIDKLTDGEVITRLRHSLGFTETMKAEEARLEQQRATAAVALEELAKDRVKRRPGLVSKRDKALEKVRAAEAVVLALSREWARAQREVGTFDAQHDGDVRRAEEVLRATAPVEVVEARRKLWETLQGARSAFVAIDRVPAPQLFQTSDGAKTMSNAANTDNLALAAIKGVERCDALVTAPISRTAILEELARIVATIPAADFAFEVDVEGRGPLFERVGT